MPRRLPAAVFLAAVTLLVSAVVIARTKRGIQTNAAASDLSQEMMSNSMIAGFDPDAGLRGAQASSDPTKRIETLSRPGTTTVELAVNGHRAEAVVSILRLPDSLDLETWPGMTLVGDYDASQPYAITEIELRIDGCIVDAPYPQAVLASPHSIELSHAKRQWTLAVQSNNSYNFKYVFAARGVTAQLYSSSAAGSYDADWRISRDDYGEPVTPDCSPLKSRRYGSRAELRAGLVR